MTTLCEYTTVTKVKLYKDSQLVSSDGLILDMIRQTSREIEDITNRRYFPTMEIDYFDTPLGNHPIIFSNDLLEVITLTNGDGTVIPSTEYKLYPLNEYPKRELILMPKKYTWSPDTYGMSFGAIALNGVFGYHADYPNAWIVTGATLAAAITTTAQTTVTATAGLLFPGDLLKLDTEYVYVAAVTPGAPSDTITMARGVNGSTAATHLISIPFYRWDPGTDIEMLVRRGATAYSKLRSNPVSETVTVDGLQFTTPKDVIQWMNLQLTGMGNVRVGIG